MSAELELNIIDRSPRRNVMPFGLECKYGGLDILQPNSVAVDQVVPVSESVIEQELVQILACISYRHARRTITRWATRPSRLACLASTARRRYHHSSWPDAFGYVIQRQRKIIPDAVSAFAADQIWVGIWVPIWVLHLDAINMPRPTRMAKSLDGATDFCEVTCLRRRPCCIIERRNGAPSRPGG